MRQEHDREGTPPPTKPEPWAEDTIPAAGCVFSESTGRMRTARIASWIEDALAAADLTPESFRLLDHDA